MIPQFAVNAITLIQRIQMLVHVLLHSQLIMVYACVKLAHILR